MLALLHQNTLLLLFVVASTGYLVGRVRVLGVSLGVAAVLFVGLAASGLDSALKLPEVIPELGLALFVYTLGVASGPGFFASFRARGARDAGLAALAIGLAASVAIAAHFVLHLRAPLVAGVLAGALTNTPALAEVLHHLRETGVTSEAALAEPVVGYSLAYPIGVLGVIVALAITIRREKREPSAPVSLSGAPRIAARTVRVTRAAAIGKPAHALLVHEGFEARFGRIRRAETTQVTDDLTVLAEGDLLTVIGAPKEVDRVIDFLGEASNEALELDRHVLDYRRMFVSNARLAGKPLRDLELQKRFGATVTRVRRGDVEMLAEDDTVLQLGDRVRVVAPREKLDEIARLLGDSYKALSEVDVISFGVGIALGLLLGQIPLPLPGGASFRLGSAGGPLVLGLVLGRAGRTGPLVWSMPYSANLTLRQLGLVLFLAGVGTRAGGAFAATIAQGGALPIFATAIAVSAVSATTALVFGRRLGISPSLLLGMVAGIHTQPAALAFASDSARGEAPNVGYSAVFPVATILKIVVAQVLVGVLGGR